MGQLFSQQAASQDSRLGQRRNKTELDHTRRQRNKSKNYSTPKRTDSVLDTPLHDAAYGRVSNKAVRDSKGTRFPTSSHKRGDRPKASRYHQILRPDHRGQRDRPRGTDTNRRQYNKADNRHSTKTILKNVQIEKVPSSSSTHNASRKSRSRATKDCMICANTRSLHHFPHRNPTAQCEHETDVCRKCLRTWIASEFKAKMWDEINCPVCSQRLQHEDMRAFAPSDVFRRYMLRPIPNYPILKLTIFQIR